MKYPLVRLMGKKPEQDTVEISEDRLVSIPDFSVIRLSSASFLEKRTGGNLVGKAIFLPTGYEYQIVTDNLGYPCLIVLLPEK